MPDPDRIIRLRTVLARTGLSRSTLYRKIAEGTFPAQLRISVHGAGWRESEIDRWVADPTKPVPFYGRASKDIAKVFMTADQRFAARRTDVLSYETTVLEHDVTIVGPVDADVWFETTGTAADVVVKLIDVWPEDTKDLGGYQQLVRGEVLRGRFRNGFERGEAFVPGRRERVRVRLPDIAHTFRTGHRIAVQVQSSWFPFVDSNPQKFMDIAKADVADFTVATHTVHRSAAAPSGLTVRVLEGRLP